MHQEYAVHRGASSSDDGILYQGTDGLDFASNFKTRKGLGIVHLNARNLFPKLDSLRIWISNSDPDIIVISESWLKNNVSDSVIYLHGYNAFRVDRVIQGGGVAIYVRNNLNTFVKVSTSVPGQFDLQLNWVIMAVLWLLWAYIAHHLLVRML